MTPAELEVWVAESCTRHGVPFRVADSRVIASVATLMAPRAGRAAAGAPSPATLTRSKGLQPPHRINPPRIQTPRPGFPGADDNMVEYRRHDGVLAIQTEIRPLHA